MPNSATKKQSVEEWMAQGNQVQRVPRGGHKPTRPDVAGVAMVETQRRANPRRATKPTRGRSTAARMDTGRAGEYEVERLAKERAAKRERSE